MMVTPNVRLARRLGVGSMGEVWVADHLTLKTQVAVKFISQKMDLDDPEVLLRFNREASTAAQIKSPYVVQTFDQGVTGQGTPYIVMELLEGESLGDRLDRTGWLSLRQTAQVVAQTAKALSAAHKLGIVHRDIKPDNIFLVPTDDGLLVKVLDFGIAKETQLPKMAGLTSPGVMVGTPEFMSPEQALTAGEVDYRADLWALGVLTYVCVTGTLPFLAEAVGELCVMLVEAAFQPPSQRREPGVVPPAIDEWFQKVLHRDAKLRYSSAKEMALGLVRAIPPGSEDLEDEVLDTGEHRIPLVARRAATSIGIGRGGQRRQRAAAAADPAAPTRQFRHSSDAITMPKLARPRSRRAVLFGGLAAGLVVLLGVVGLIVAWAATGVASDQADPSATAVGEVPSYGPGRHGELGPSDLDTQARSPGAEGPEPGALSTATGTARGEGGASSLPPPVRGGPRPPAPQHGNKSSTPDPGF